MEQHGADESSSFVSEMEKIRVDLKREAFFCTICQDLLKDPVALPCGQSCVEASWDRGDERNIYQCPQCRQSFSSRPLLQKNLMLSELVEELKKTGLQAAGPEDVTCDSSTGRKQNACLVSQPPGEEPSFRRQKQLQGTCSQRDEEREMFCGTDQQVIYHLCTVDQHKDHHIVSAAAERGEREKEVGQKSRKDPGERGGAEAASAGGGEHQRDC
ncbi:E3 ubiquitin/ISG15 ligase TRIM25-like [Synchiropus splendidus]|uniref:E3 ubiquitin/ISG15 ligase TRIM25-like n=1 Tax=Synchiropus splendidus TaxID=270530 RepID=UPI00237EDA84|nr:E3 ubiquitin/ISG15 ligase TRIM25-like [Synchiropus splendidus]